MAPVISPDLAPTILENHQFRNLVRDRLVVLGNKSSGLGVKVTGKEHAVVIFPRAGRSLSTLGEMLELTWVEVTVTGTGPDSGVAGFRSIGRDEAQAFLKSLVPA